MNNNAKEWVKELRTTKHLQIQGQMRTHGENDIPAYCVLGIACEVYRKEHPEVEWVYFSQGMWSFLDNMASLPEVVQTWLGLRTAYGHFQLPKMTRTSLAQQNDSGFMSFERLAKLIESEPEGLFE